MQLEAVLQQGGQLEAARRLTDQAADLPEQGFLLARLRPQRGAVDRAVALGQHAQPDPAHQLAGAPLHGGAGPARDQHVGDGERRIERQVRRVAAGAHLLGPQVARDVEHEAAAVALAVDAPGAVEHVLERAEGLVDRGVRRPAVLGDPAVEGTRVVLLHGPGRPQPNSASITLRSSGSLADPRWMAPLMKNRGVLGIPLPAPLA